MKEEKQKETSLERENILSTPRLSKIEEDIKTEAADIGSFKSRINHSLCSSLSQVPKSEKPISHSIVGEWNIYSEEANQSVSLSEQAKKGLISQSSKYKKERSIAVKNFLDHLSALEVIEPRDRIKRNLPARVYSKKKISPLANSLKKADENQQGMQDDKLKKYRKLREKRVKIYHDCPFD